MAECRLMKTNRLRNQLATSLGMRDIAPISLEEAERLLAVPAGTARADAYRALLDARYCPLPTGGFRDLGERDRWVAAHPHCADRLRGR